MRIRLHGSEDECTRTAEFLAQVLDVLDISRPYRDRPPSRLARMYLTTALPTADSTKEK
ncbi:hypothetical protein SMD11_5620 [Streptomyces albireticuli]|uniref:Uncharacterized protein n=1 Tax=Streptomyces albireticuli TaxID=1940 RepID=A0A1Z2LA53_9ACTN|nr:hypothetical protein SMD11_5620 [Streptomyces albireticuli]